MQQNLSFEERMRKDAIENEGQYTPGGGLYGAFDVMAVELEVAELLIAIVRAIKPHTILELGSGKGYSTMALAHGCHLNEGGSVYAWEPNKEHREDLVKRCQDLPVRVMEGPKMPVEPDMVFIDSGPDYRLRDMNRWVEETVFLLIHDAHRYTLPVGGFMFQTPRGLWMRDYRPPERYCGH